MTKAAREDFDFTSEIAAATHEGPPRYSLALLFVVASLLVSFLVWAYYAKVDEMTRGEGQVISSRKTQIVQSLEAGIIKEILVKTGARVTKGQVLLRIDDTSSTSSFGELRAKQINLTVQIARLRAEVDLKTENELKFPDDLSSKYPKITANETELFHDRLRSLNNQTAILNERLKQRKQELIEIRSSTKRHKTNLAIANREHDIKAPLAERGIVPKTDILKLDREISDLEGKFEAATQAVPRLKSAILEAERQIDEQRLLFKKTAQTEMNERLAEIAVVNQTIKAARDRVSRTGIRSPVDGIINKLNVNTIGRVVSAAETLVEIVPLDDTLLIEAKIKPSDIAFVSPNLPAVVKITAYDFSIYGGLEGWVEQISADSQINEQTRESYYTVTIRTKSVNLGNSKKILPIIPGMVASVDIITGKKSVLDYILKPILKAKNEALRER